MRQLVRAAACCASTLAAAGALVLGAPAPAFAAAPPPPTVNCDLYFRQFAIVFVGYATAPPGYPEPVELTVICSYTNDKGQYYSVNSSPGYAVATFGSGLMGPAPMTICATAIARYADGEVATTSDCHPPVDPLDPVDPVLNEVLRLISELDD